MLVPFPSGCLGSRDRMRSQPLWLSGRHHQVAKVMAFGDGDLDEVMRVVSPWWTQCPYIVSSSTMWGHSEAVATCKPGRGLSPGTKADSTLTLDLQPPELWEVNACCLSHSVYGILFKQPTLTKTRALPHPPFPPATPTFLCVRTFSVRHAFPAHVMSWKCWGITLLGNNN